MKEGIWKGKYESKDLERENGEGKKGKEKRLGKRECGRAKVKDRDLNEEHGEGIGQRWILQKT